MSYVQFVGVFVLLTVGIITTIIVALAEVARSSGTVIVSPTPAPAPEPTNAPPTPEPTNTQCIGVYPVDVATNAYFDTVPSSELTVFSADKRSSVLIVGLANVNDNDGVTAIVDTSTPTLPIAYVLEIPQTGRFFGATVSATNDARILVVAATDPVLIFVYLRTNDESPYTLYQTIDLGVAVPRVAPSIAITDDGVMIVVGVASFGTIYVFQANPLVNYTETQRFNYTSCNDDDGSVVEEFFGLSLSMDVNTNQQLAVGAASTNSVCMYERKGNHFEFVERLGLATATSANFGRSVALSGDSRTLVVGQSEFEINGPGAVYVYQRASVGIPFGAANVEIVATGENPGDQLGMNVDVSSFGDRVIASGLYIANINPIVLTKNGTQVPSYSRLNVTLVELPRQVSTVTMDNTGANVFAGYIGYSQSTIIGVFAWCPT